MLTMLVLTFAAKKGWITTGDSTTFIRSEIAKARVANSQKLTLKSTNKYPGT